MGLRSICYYLKYSKRLEAMRVTVILVGTANYRWKPIPEHAEGNVFFFGSRHPGKMPTQLPEFPKYVRRAFSLCYEARKAAESMVKKYILGHGTWDRETFTLLDEVLGNPGADLKLRDPIRWSKYKARGRR